MDTYKATHRKTTGRKSRMRKKLSHTGHIHPCTKKQGQKHKPASSTHTQIHSNTRTHTQTKDTHSTKSHHACKKRVSRGPSISQLWFEKFFKKRIAVTPETGGQAGRSYFLPDEQAQPARRLRQLSFAGSRVIDSRFGLRWLSEQQ